MCDASARFGIHRRSFPDIYWRAQHRFLSLIKHGTLRKKKKLLINAIKFKLHVHSLTRLRSSR